MSPIPELQALVANLRDELSTSTDNETGGDSGVPGLDTDGEVRIHAIVQEHGGRVRQQTILTETEWSASKVSRVLNHMETKESIRRISTGREKIVVLPEYLPNRADAE